MSLYRFTESIRGRLKGRGPDRPPHAALGRPITPTPSYLGVARETTSGPATPSPVRIPVEGNAAVIEESDWPTRRWTPEAVGEVLGRDRVELVDEGRVFRSGGQPGPGGQDGGNHERVQAVDASREQPAGLREALTDLLAAVEPITAIEVPNDDQWRELAQQQTRAARLLAATPPGSPRPHKPPRDRALERGETGFGIDSHG